MPIILAIFVYPVAYGRCAYILHAYVFSCGMYGRCGSPYVCLQILKRIMKLTERKLFLSRMSYTRMECKNLSRRNLLLELELFFYWTVCFDEALKGLHKNLSTVSTYPFVCSFLSSSKKSNGWGGDCLQNTLDCTVFSLAFSGKYVCIASRKL